MFSSPWCHCKFSFSYSFRPHCGPGVNSASNRNEYQEYFLGGKGSRCIGLTTLPLSCADCLVIWEPQPPGTPWACSRIALPLPCHNVNRTFTYLMNNIVPFYYAVTQCHSQAGSTHSGGSRFNSHLGYWHPPSPSTLNPGMVLQNMQQPLPSKFCMVL